MRENGSLRRFAFLCLASLAACTDAPEDRPATWGYIHAAVIAPNCATSSCHSELATTAGVVLDGFPRTRAQAEAFDASLARRGQRLTAAVYIGVREAELIRRLSGRWVCRANGHLFHATDGPPKVPGVCDFDGSELYQRDDDRPETVRARLEQQLPPMFDVVDYYRDAGVLLTVDGEQEFDQVKDSLLRALGDQLHLPGGAGRR